jgi:RNA polymerase sigma-70 factor (ECF subfamily)
VTRNLERDPWRAEDVAQETLLAALAASRLDVPNEQRMRAWLGRVAFNLSRLGARQGARRQAREVCVARREALPSVSDELEARSAQRTLAQALNALPADYREVLAWRYFDGDSTAEIAARLHVSELAVRKRLWRARNKLRAALEHEAPAGRHFLGLLPLVELVRRSRVALLAAPAAGIAATVFLLLPSGTEHDEGVARLASATRLGAASAPSRVSEFSDGVPAAEPPSPSAPHRSERPPSPRSAVPPVPVDSREEWHGVVLDLEGTPRAGLELFDAEARAPLATSDLLGAFCLSGASAGPLWARAPGWTTVVPATLEESSGAFAPLLVAEAFSCAGRVVDGAGAPIVGAELELLCTEGAFARFPLPVALAHPRLGVERSDDDGHFEIEGWPQAQGIDLWVRAEGYAPLRRSSPSLGAAEWLVLEPEPNPTFLTGTVRHRSGDPAGGAWVQLAEARVQADADGRFRLPLRGVRPDSTFQAEDPEQFSSPFTWRGFGKRLESGFAGDFEVELGEENDAVEGQLQGDGPGGWRVAAFARAAFERDAEGFERPVAVTTSAADGSFALRLPRGRYDFVALAPDRLEGVPVADLDSSVRHWSIPLTAPAPLLEQRALIQARTGEPLGRVPVEVEARFQGAEPGSSRRLPWRVFATERDGTVSFLAAQGHEFELHAARGHFVAARWLGSAREAGLELALAAPFHVRLRGSHAVLRARVLDEWGTPLPAHGPLGPRAGFEVTDGESPVYEVPPEARWLELGRLDGRTERVPVAPQLGAPVLVLP